MSLIKAKKMVDEAFQKMKPVVVYIDDERVIFDAKDTTKYEDNLLLITLKDGREYYIATDSEDAGKAARKYWKELAESDPAEFRVIVGDESLVKWALGQSAGPGTTAVNSLEEWLDIWLGVPEEQWASYDGTEVEFKSEHPDFKKYTVCYRHN